MPRLLRGYASKMWYWKQVRRLARGHGISLEVGGEATTIPLGVVAVGRELDVVDRGFLLTQPLQAIEHQAIGDAALAMRGVDVEPVDHRVVIGTADRAPHDLDGEEADHLLPANGGEGEVK